MEDDSVLNAIIIASVIGIIVVVGLILFYPRPSEDFTAVYFGNYSKEPGAVSFEYTIENHENKDMIYGVSYFAGNDTIFKENVFVLDGGNVTLLREMNASSGMKVGVLLNTTEEIHFWIK